MIPTAPPGKTTFARGGGTDGDATALALAGVDATADDGADGTVDGIVEGDTDDTAEGDAETTGAAQLVASCCFSVDCALAV
jgi:hypothetical protein